MNDITLRFTKVQSHFSFFPPKKKKNREKRTDVVRV